MAEVSLKVTSKPLDSVESLKADWESLEKHAEPTVFLSWQWIGVWLWAYRPVGHVIRAYDGEELVGIGIIVSVVEWRHQFLRSRTLRLHQLGDVCLDQIWIEYNGFLSKVGWEDRVNAAAMKYLCNEFEDWDEFIVGAIDSKLADSYARNSGLRSHIRWEAPRYGVDLEVLRSSQRAYLSTLSRNTRYQINRSKRIYLSEGKLSIERPESVEDALQIFDQIGPLHRDKWGDSTGGSGFANPMFLKFHHRLIRDYWEKGGVDIVLLKVGNKKVATFYNLVYDKVVYFYLNGLDKSGHKHEKPGLVGHSLCIEDYCQDGFSFYDFMGGAERYKASLGKETGKLVQVSLQRNRIKLRMEDAVRRLRRAIP